MTAKSKKIIKTLVIVLFILIGCFEALFFYVNDLVKPEVYERQILSEMRKQIGQNVQIKGGTRFALLPYPKLVLSGLVIGTETEGTPSEEPVFRIENVEITIRPSTLFSNSISLSSVNLINLTLSLQRSGDNTIHWAWLNTKLLKLLNGKKGGGISLPLFVKNGSIVYEDLANNKNVTIENINAKSVYGANTSINGSMDVEGNTLGFVIDGKSDDAGKPLSDFEFPINIKLNESDKHSIVIQTIIDSSGDFPKVSGKFDFNTSDLDNFLDLVVRTNLSNKNEQNRFATSLALKGLWGLEDDVIKMNSMDVNGLNSIGKGSAEISWHNWYPTISTDISFDYIDYLTWKRLLDRRIINKTVSQNHNYDDEEVATYDFRKENPLPENIEIRMNIKAKTVLFDKDKWRNTNLNAVLDKGAFTINQLDFILDGDGVLSIFGVVSQSGTGELRFEGNVEGQGQSLRKAISMFYSSARDLPPIAMDYFKINANMYITAGQIRLFETKGVINEVDLDGSITIYLEEPLRVNAAIKFNDMNFDYIRDEMRKQKAEELTATKNKKSKKESKQQDIIGFDWLKYLGIRIDAKLIFDNFTFMEKKGENATLSLYAYRGDLRILNFQMPFPSGTDEINCNIDARGALPFYNVMINADTIDTSYFDLSPKSVDDSSVFVDEADEKTTLDSQIPLEWMDKFNGIFDITLRKLIDKNFVMDRIKLQAKLENKILSIQKFGFVFSQAESYVVGTVFGGKVPGLNISFTMSNADIYEVIEPITGLTNISGFANLSGNVLTSGWSYLEWLKNSDSKVLLTARGVKVSGINLDGVSNIVEVARSSADVFNNVNNVLTKGTTEFAVDGLLSVKEGKLRAPNLALRAGLIPGIIVGGVELQTLDGDFSSKFYFNNISTEMAPMLIIQLSGNMNKPEIKVDTASLEAFVANRNIIK